jgi:hypothetical protein
VTDTISPSPPTKQLDPTKPLTPGDLARLQSNRAAARKWLDSCEVDRLEAERILAVREDEEGRAREALRKAEAEIDQWRVPVALRRVG